MEAQELKEVGPPSKSRPTLGKPTNQKKGETQNHPNDSHAFFKKPKLLLHNATHVH